MVTFASYKHGSHTWGRKREDNIMQRWKRKDANIGKYSQNLRPRSIEWSLFPFIQQETLIPEPSTDIYELVIWEVKRTTIELKEGSLQGIII